MKFICEQCKTKYSIADEKVSRKVLKIRCKNCGHIIVVRDPNVATRSRRNTGAAALDQAFDGAFAVGGAEQARVAAPGQRVSVKAVQPSARVGPIGLLPREEPEESPTFLSGMFGAGRTDESVHEDEWYMAVDGHQFGPMSFEELGSRVRRGEARADGGEEAYVWRDGFDDWVEVGSVPELRPYVPPPPPPRGRSGLFTHESLDSDGVAAAQPSDLAPPQLSVAAVGAPPSRAFGSGRPSGAAEPSVAALAPMMEAFAGGASQPLGPAAAQDAFAIGPATAVPPTSPRTSLAMILAAIGGIGALLCGLYLVFFLERGPAAPTSSAPAQPSLAGAVEGRGGSAEEPAPASAGDEERSDLEFQPLKVGLSPKGGGKVQRPAGRATEAPRRSHEPADGLTAEQRRLMEIYGNKEKVAGGPIASTRRDRGPVSRPSRAIRESEVRERLQHSRQAIQACYDRALKRDYSLKDVRADVTLVVGTTGMVQRVNFAGVTNEVLLSCLRANFLRWKFRPLGGSSSRDVGFPLLFRGS